MDLEAIKKENLELAKDKGLGSVPEEILVPEKVVLIHSEISEGYDAFLRDDLNGEHGFYMELADALLRTLHLSGIFGIVFASQLPVKLLPADVHAQIALLHKILSESYENYRHQRVEDFKTKLVELTSAFVEMGRVHRFDMEQQVKKKMEMNKGRSWNKDELNENIG